MSSRELRFAYIGTGVFAGLGLVVILYSWWFSALGSNFSFASFISLHQENAWFYLIDLVPLLFIVAAWLISEELIRRDRELSNRNLIEKKNDEAMKVAINELTKGRAFSELESSAIEPEVKQSMLELKQRLEENKLKEQSRRMEDDQRNWISEGIAEFGDILRRYSDNLEELGYAVISQLVRYLEINQGGFFITEKAPEHDEINLKMIACHAYSRRKFPDKILSWGEGLIGAVALEKKSYYTDRIPDGYLTITSGLGKANPRYLLLVPMVLNEEVFGVMELASFKPLADHQIQFVERIAENTAMTLNILQSNLRTTQLLKETQAQAAQLSQQEENVRKNIEELKMIQAEAARQSEQFVSFTNSVNHTLIRAEYDTSGKLLYANTKFLKKMGYSGNREVEGKHISLFIHEKDRDWFDSIWNGLSKGGAHFEGYMKHITKQGKDLWTMATYTCVRREDGTVEKILFLAIDTTEQKHESLDFEGQISAINSLSPKAEFKPDGRLLGSNDLFESTLKYTREELEDKYVFDFVQTSDQERFNEIWEQVITRNTFQGQLRMLTKFGEDLWFRASFSAVEDMYGDVEKVVFIANEITKEREMEISLREQHKALIKKEEEMRLQTLDLKKEIHYLTENHENERQRLDAEKRIAESTLEQLPYPVLTINNQGYVTGCNMAAQKYWGRKSSQIVTGKADVLFDREQPSAEITAFIDPAKAKKEVSAAKVIIRLPDRTEREETISILKAEISEEIYYSLLIHKGA